MIAVASGVPPSHVEDVSGAEAWALAQATGIADYDSTFRVDCRSCVDAVHAGLKLQLEWTLKQREKATQEVLSRNPLGSTDEDWVLRFELFKLIKRKTEVNS